MVHHHGATSNWLRPTVLRVTICVINDHVPQVTWRYELTRSLFPGTHLLVVFTHAIVRRMVQGRCTIQCIFFDFRAQRVRKLIDATSLLWNSFATTFVRCCSFAHSSPPLSFLLLMVRGWCAFWSTSLPFWNRNVRILVVGNEFSFIRWCVCKVPYILY